MIEPKVDGDLYYFNYSQYINPALMKEFEERYDVRGHRVLLRLDGGDAGQAPGRQRVRRDVPHGRVRAAARPGGAAAADPARQAREHRQHLQLLRRSLVRPRLLALGPLLALHHRDRLPGGHPRQHDRLLGRPRQRGGGGADLRARRLPGGARRGQPPQRLRHEHGRRGGAGCDPGLAGRPEAAPARLLGGHDHAPCRAATPGSSTCGTATSSTSATGSTTPRPTSSRRSSRTGSRSAATRS